MLIKVQPQPTGLILAGGRSRRFGVDKALFVWQGKPLIAHVYQVLAQVADPILVAAGAADARYPVPARMLADTVADGGPLAGLQAGLQAADSGWVLVLPCDVPYITLAVLHRLLAARTPVAQAVVARTPEGRVHPLCGCYASSVLPVVAAQCAAGRLAVHGVLDLLEEVVLVDVPAAPLRNVNRKADLPYDL